MTSFLYAIPLLHPDSGSYVTSNCLRNTPVFETLRQFYTEYMLVGKDEIEKLFQVSRRLDSRDKANDEAIQKLQDLLRKRPEALHYIEPEMLEHCGLMSVLDLTQEALKTVDLKSLCTREWDTIELDGSESVNALAAYSKWGRTSSSKLDYSSLLSRSFVQKWVYALFFKIVLPVDRSSQDFDHQLIYCPLNLSVFFRVLAQLHSNGYPSHWLSDVLCQILENKVITCARPPRTSPLDVEEFQKDNPMKKLSTAPWLSEMRTLAAMFEPILPFSLITNAVPKLSSIYEYTIDILLMAFGRPDTPVNTLVFFHQGLVERALADRQLWEPSALRQVLHPEFEGQSKNSSSFGAYHAVQESGLRVVTTLCWDSKTQQATFWMPEEDMIRMEEDNQWRVSIWRTDTWEAVSPPFPINDPLMITRKNRWIA